MIDIKTLVRDNIQQLVPYSSARDEFRGDGIFLDANENPYGQWNRYPDPYQQTLKSELANWKDVPPENIFVGNGSDEIIDLLFRIFCEPGKDKALTFSPTYGMYQVSAAINNIELVEIPLDDNFQIRIDPYEELISQEKLKLLFLCSPNNPTGNLMDPADIERILRTFPGVVVIDEAYIDFSSTESWSKRLWEFDNLVILQTMSKAFGLAGARIGIGLTSVEIISILNKVKPPYNVSELNQIAALDALKNQGDFRQRLDEIGIEKQRIIQALSQMENVRKIYPSDTNFILVEIDEADALYRSLAASKIVVRNRTSLISNCLRITVGTAAENTALINNLKKRNNEESTVY